jgi:hypothetical protein
LPAVKINVASLGLTNIELIHCDILDFDPSSGQFDYIIAHGVYSLVPHVVREKIMAIFKAHLAPHGVAYVSYNSHPFSHTRNLARDMMLFHTRHLTKLARSKRFRRRGQL